MGEELDVDTLKRRGRRRLIGAIALVLLAVLILPMVFDPEPGPALSSVQVRIPGEGDGSFVPKGEATRALSENPASKASAASDPADPGTERATPVAPTAPTVVSSAPAGSVAPGVVGPSLTPAQAVAVPASDAKGISQEKVVPEPKAFGKGGLPGVAPVAPPSGGKNEASKSTGKSGFVVQIAAFSSEQKLGVLVAQLKVEKIAYYTEPVATAKGLVTRIRAGPFETKEAAERVRERLVRIGLKPGPSIPREG
jgi:DedD protein